MTKFLEFYIALTSPPKKDERGATATEYGLLVAFIALAIILAVTAFGTALSGFFTDLAAEVEGWVVP